MNIAFEELTDKDFAEIHSIYNYYVLNTTVTFHANVLSEDEMRTLVFFKSPPYKTFSIRLDGSICGYVILTQFKKREAYDETAEVTIYLKPEYTGRGIGVKAVSYIEEYAKNQHMHVLIAGICGENISSIKLFEKCGFEKCAHFKEVGIKFGKRLDVVYYQKIINTEIR